jgi:hypothetical protein
VRVALGLRAHSGWAALVALGREARGLAVVERRRLELVDAADAAWAKQPYHAAEGLDPEDARDVVERAVAAAHRHAERELGAAAERARSAGHEVAACAVLMGDPLPGWSVAEVLAVHFRMHKAEGVLFREALAEAAGRVGLPLVPLREKDLPTLAARTLGKAPDALAREVAGLGRPLGPPWGRDQKDAALAALVGLTASPKG